MALIMRANGTSQVCTPDRSNGTFSLEFLKGYDAIVGDVLVCENGEIE
ncbi:MAG: hypothetical protein GWN58_28590 [Anaerolineae bacterium]|nr:hypothetical protein [Anaerolineae bacterium]